MSAQKSPWFMRPLLRCGEYWTEWVAPPGLGRSVWSEATASQTPLWSAARRPTALRGQMSPQGGLHLHLQRKGYRWNQTLHLYCFQYLESLRFEDLKARVLWSIWIEIKFEVKTYLDWAFHYHLVVVWLVHKTLYGTEGCLSVFSLNHLH